jgi:hypothetical protein
MKSKRHGKAMPSTGREFSFYIHSDIRLLMFTW